MKAQCLRLELVKYIVRIFLSQLDTTSCSSAQQPGLWAAHDCCHLSVWQQLQSEWLQPSRWMHGSCGSPDCTHCPAGTEPAVGFEYKWWNTLPTNMETTVLSGINFEYKGMTGNCLSLCHELSAPWTPSVLSTSHFFIIVMSEKNKLTMSCIPLKVPFLMDICSAKTALEEGTELETWACTSKVLLWELQGLWPKWQDK